MEVKEFKVKKDYTGLCGAILLGALFLLLFVSFVYHPYGPEEMDATSRLMAPSLKHWFGCDNFGRDIFIRVQRGIGTTFLIAFSTVLIGASIGTVIGAVTGYYGGVMDKTIMSVNDVLFAFPSILLALLMVSILGGGTSRVVIALGIAVIPSFVRMVRGEFIKQREMDYVNLARLIGVGPIRIIFVHIMPNIFPVLKTCVLVAFNNAVLAEAGMSYLGIGVQPPTASLGRMLSEAQTYLRTAPWYSVFPGLTIVLLVLAVTLLGEADQRKKIMNKWKLVTRKDKREEH